MVAEALKSIDLHKRVLHEEEELGRGLFYIYKLIVLALKKAGG